jgi:hypothetical protein
VTHTSRTRPFTVAMAMARLFSNTAAFLDELREIKAAAKTQVPMPKEAKVSNSAE